MAREKLVVELKAEELIAEAARRLKLIREPCNASIHLEKSADSTYFNIGEGTVLFKPKLKASKYDIARAEANEVKRALRALVLKGKLTQADVGVADDLADCIIGMLTNMIKHLEDRM